MGKTLNIAQACLARARRIGLGGSEQEGTRTWDVLGRSESSYHSHRVRHPGLNAGGRSFIAGHSASIHSPLHLGSQMRQTDVAKHQPHPAIYPAPSQPRMEPIVQAQALIGPNATPTSLDIAAMQSRLQDRGQPQIALHSRTLQPTTIENASIPSRLGVQSQIKTDPVLCGQNAAPTTLENASNPRTQGLHARIGHAQTQYLAMREQQPSASTVARGSQAMPPTNVYRTSRISPHRNSVAPSPSVQNQEPSAMQMLPTHPHLISPPQHNSQGHAQRLQCREDAAQGPLSALSAAAMQRQVLPLDRGQSSGLSVRPAPGVTVSNQVAEQRQGAAAERDSVARDRRERPPIPRNPQRSENVSSRALRSLEESISNKFSELFGRIRSLESATIAMGENICGALDGVRADGDSQAKMLMECHKQVGERICQSMELMRRAPAADNDGDALAKELSDAQDYVKYMTCVQYLDAEQGSTFYCTFISQSKAFESPLVRHAAQFVLGDNADIVEFLKKLSPTKKNGKVIMVDNATLIGRGQGTAQESIRKNLVSSFSSSCPRSSALHISTKLAPNDAKRILLRMYEAAEHKYDTSLAAAWRAAQHGAMSAAYKTAKGAHTTLTMHHPGRDITQLPAKPTNADLCHSKFPNTWRVWQLVGKEFDSLMALLGHKKYYFAMKS